MNLSAKRDISDLQRWSSLQINWLGQFTFMYSAPASHKNWLLHGVLPFLHGGNFTWYVSYLSFPQQ